MTIYKLRRRVGIFISSFWCCITWSGLEQRRLAMSSYCCAASTHFLFWQVLNKGIKTYKRIKYLIISFNQVWILKLRLIYFGKYIVARIYKQLQNHFCNWNKCICRIYRRQFRNQPSGETCRNIYNFPEFLFKCMYSFLWISIYK